MKKSGWLLLSLMLVLSMFLAACNNGGDSTEPANNEDNNSQEPVDGGDLIFASAGEPTLFNPFYSSDTVSSNVEGLVYSGLVTSDLEFNPVWGEGTGALAEDVQQSEDGLTYTVKIRDGVTFHDGEPLTADDVVFTYNIPLNEAYDGPRKSSFTSIVTVEKVDDLTVKFTLKQKDAQFLPTALSYGILPEHILKDVPVAELGEYTEFNSKPIGSGPFVFSEWKDGEYVKATAYEDYYEGRPHLDSVTMKIVGDQNAALNELQAGTANYFDAVPPADVSTVETWLDGVGLKMESGLALSYTFLSFNMDMSKGTPKDVGPELTNLFKQKEFRQAITHAIDRDAIVENIMDGRGEVAHTPDSPLSWAYNPDVPKFEYDPELAGEMLDDLGWTVGSDGIREKNGEKLSFTVSTNQGNQVREDIVVLLQNQLKEIGIDAQPNIKEFSALIADLDPDVWNFEAMVLGWSLSTDPNPADIFHSREIAQGLNFTHYSNPELDTLMDQQLQELDKDKRKDIIGEIEAGLAEDQAYTFLYYPEEYRAMPANLQGYEFHAKDPLYNIFKWWFAPEGN
ncbi:peptide-binding protein [Bacillaceae bacterium Marseille-Q3522]|nr:peptide-binding protein [Bacillaceae bacterium Marseille-Q3522]